MIDTNKVTIATVNEIMIPMLNSNGDLYDEGEGMYTAASDSQVNIFILDTCDKIRGLRKLRGIADSFFKKPLDIDCSGLNLTNVIQIDYLCYNVTIHRFTGFPSSAPKLMCLTNMFKEAVFVNDNTDTDQVSYFEFSLDAPALKQVWSMFEDALGLRTIIVNLPNSKLSNANLMFDRNAISWHDYAMVSANKLRAITLHTSFEEGAQVGSLMGGCMALEHADLPDLSKCNPTDVRTVFVGVDNLIKVEANPETKRILAEKFNIF